MQIKPDMGSRAWQNRRMGKNEKSGGFVQRHGAELGASLALPKLHGEDARFANRLMSQPAPGLAWAARALSGEDESSHRVAVWCCLHAGPFWTEEAQGEARRARIAGLAHKRWGPLFVRELARIWLSEPGSGGPREWMAALNDLKSSGVDEGIGSVLARLAVAEPRVRAELDAEGEGGVKALFEVAVSELGCAPEEWQAELASRLGAAECRYMLACTFIGPLAQRSELMMMHSPSRAVCAAMAARVLGDPKQAFFLLHGMFMRGVFARSAAGYVALAGVFDALTADPSPRLIKPESERGGGKIMGGFRGPLAMAMELMCRGRFGAGLAAARWAAKLGAGGSEPANELTDGLSSRRISMGVRAFKLNGWENGAPRGEARARAMSEPGMLFGRVDVCSELRSMGWGWPGKARAAALREELGALREEAAHQNAPGLLPIGSGLDVDAGVMAVWESMQIERMLSKPSKTKVQAPVPGGRGLRM